MPRTWSTARFYAGTKYYPIDDPAGTGTSIETINDSNVIIGRFLPTGDSQFQGFVGFGVL